MRNPSVWKAWLSRMRGAGVQLDLRAYDAELTGIAGLEPGLRSLSESQLLDRSQEIRTRVRSGQPLRQSRAPFFAIVREAARRGLGQRPFDVQIVAALGLDDGHVVEMQTGEGKTLAAVLPAALNALSGRGVHVLTFNDYLARRDAGWMAPVYRALGLSVGSVQEGMTSADRRAAYLADVTYVTAKEAGFDHLRDCLATDPSALVHRPFHYALVDEADSIFIDEARVPLVIAGGFERGESMQPRLAALVATLLPGVHFDTDEYGRDVELTDAGIDYVEQALGCGALHREPNHAWLTAVNCALHARVLLRRDVDYIVREGRIAIVDEFTGRVVVDRHWPDGLQGALEAKEGIEGGAEGRILGSLTLHQLNARNDAAEAQIVAEAGAPGTVTISTSMAGRGTDIRLGGAGERDRARVAALGGLYVIGTGRHESRRVDLQLRGRAGRQGDPGESRFFVSLDDDLLVRYGIQRLLAGRFESARSDAPVDNPVVRREIARAQRIVEGQNFETRRTLDRYTAVIEEQHRRLMAWRQDVLLGRDGASIWQQDPERRAGLVSAAGEAAVREAERVVSLSCIDRGWRDHLAHCADVREGIHLVRLGGQDPLTRFTSEAIHAFTRLEETIDGAVREALERVRIRTASRTCRPSDSRPLRPRGRTW